MADTLHELISEATAELRSKANDLDHSTTSIEELRELASGIASDKSERICTFPSVAIDFLAKSGEDGWILLNDSPDEAYGGDTPLTLLMRNIEEAIYNVLHDEAADIMDDWEIEAEEEGDDYDDVPDFDQDAGGTFHAIWS